VTVHAAFNIGAFHSSWGSNEFGQFASVDPFPSPPFFFTSLSLDFIIYGCRPYLLGVFRFPDRFPLPLSQHRPVCFSLFLFLFRARGECRGEIRFVRPWRLEHRSFREGKSTRAGPFLLLVLIMAPALLLCCHLASSSTLNHTTPIIIIIIIIIIIFFFFSS